MGHIGTHHTIVQRVAAVLTVGAGLALLAAGRSHACMGEQYASVHFHSGEPDFGMPPRQLSEGWWDADFLSGPEQSGKHDRGWIVRSASERSYQTFADSFEQDQNRKTARAALLLEADGAIGKRRWRAARLAYTQLVQKFGWTGDLRDRISVLQHVEQMKSPNAAFLENLKRYLHGMSAADSGDMVTAQSDFETVSKSADAGLVQEHARYQLASLAYSFEDLPHAITLYQHFVHDFPHSEWCESALIMIARCCILPQVKENLRLVEGQQALDTLLKTYPKTRFYRSALGLRARVHYLKRRYREALWCYYTLDDPESVEIVSKVLPEAQQGEQRVRLLETYLRRLADRHYEDIPTLTAITRLRKALSPSDADRFASDLQRQPVLLAPYIYFRLYHCANTDSDLKHLASFADSATAHHHQDQLPPVVRVRLAEIDYCRKQYAPAIDWAGKALAANPTYDRALYVRAASQAKRRRYHAAIADLHALLAHSVNPPLRHGAREELAVVCEASGDLAGALDQYFALDYTDDIAYLLDIKMTPVQIEAYLRHAGDEQESMPEDTESGKPARSFAYTRHQMLAYTLGIRYLREEKWSQAALWLQRIPRNVRAQFDHGRHTFESKASPDALTAVKELRHLQAAIAKAHHGSERAAAQYRYASYYYTHGNLLLYNPILWNGGRNYSFSFFWNQTMDTPQSIAMVRSYMYQHEVYYRARELCLRIVRRYPKSPTAPLALYRAACASRKLANFNGWWRDETNHIHNNWDEASHLMQEVARRYPHHALAMEAKKYAGVFAQEKSGALW